MTRLIGAIGLVCAAGGILGMLSPTLDMPDAGAAPAAFAAYYEEHRDGLLALAWLNALSMGAIGAVFVALRERVRAEQPLLAGIALLNGVLTLAMTICGFTLFAAAAYRGADAEGARLATDVGWAFINTAAGPPAALSVAAFTWALVRGGHAGLWLAAVGAPVALAHLVVAAAFAQDGFLSPTGAIAYLVPCLWFAWIACASAVLLRPARP